jgi:hypothetical protein
MVCVAIACGDGAEPEAARGSGDAATAGASGDGGSGGGGGAGEGGTGAGPASPTAGCGSDAPTREELGDALEPLPAAAGARELIVAAGGLYFSDADGVKHLTGDGRAVVVLAASAFPKRLAVNDESIAWGGVMDGMEGIWTVPLAGGTPVRVHDQSIFVDNLAIDATHAYFDGATNDGLRRAPLAGGVTEHLARPFGVAAIALDGGFLYYAEPLGSPLWRVPVTGGPEEELVRYAGWVKHIALDAAAIYIGDDFGIRRFERDGAEQRLLFYLASSGVRTRNAVQRMILDGERIVFADGRENVAWVSKDGSRCAYVIATFAEVGGPYPIDIALDAQYLYLLDRRAAALFRIARSAAGL